MSAARLNITPGEKFGCFADSGFAYKDLSGEIQLGPRLWYVESLGFDMAQHWPRWLGEIKANAVKNVDFVLYTTIPSQTPMVVDGENIAVTKALDYVVYGLVLQGTPDFSKGFSFTGAHANGDIVVRQFADLKEFVTTEGLAVFRPGEAELRRAVALGEPVKLVNEGGKAHWARLCRGVSALWTATRLGGGDRLHQCARAREALVKPDIGNTKRRFTHRIDQTFALSDTETRETLHQIFDMRSHVEHVHDALDVLDASRQRTDALDRSTRWPASRSRAYLRMMCSSTRSRPMRGSTTSGRWTTLRASRCGVAVSI